MNFSIKPLKIFAVIVLLLLVFSIIHSKSSVIVLNLEEKKVFHREMVNYDIALRNAISYYALEYPNNSLKAYKQMKNFTSLEHPKLQSMMQSVIRKLKKKNVFQYVQNIQLYANKNAKSIRQSLAKNQLVDWKYIMKNLNSIADNCKACHHELDVMTKLPKK